MKESFAESLNRIKQELRVKEEERKREDLDSIYNMDSKSDAPLKELSSDFSNWIEPIKEDDFSFGDSSVSHDHTLEESEIYSDTLKTMEKGSNESKGAMIKTLLSFNDMLLPQFDKNKKSLFITRASILFQGAYISKQAMLELNESYKFDLEWTGGFLLGKNVKILAFRYWKYKNKDTYYTDKINQFVKKIRRSSGKNYVLHNNRFQLLNGFACKPIFPEVEGINLSGSWNFVGK